MARGSHSIENGRPVPRSIIDDEKGDGSNSSSAQQPVTGAGSQMAGWNGAADPENPLNWPQSKRTSHVIMVSAITFISPLASSIFAPAVPQLMAEFHSSNTELAGFVVSVYVLGFVFGPFLIAPLSELYGRLYVYHTCNILCVVFSIACAVSNSLSSLIGFRFLAGCAGASPLTLGGSTVGDVVHPEKRGSAMAVYLLGITLAPVLGPVIGGFLSQAKGWRWVFWFLAIISGAATIFMLIFMRETYAPAILGRRASRLRKEKANTELQIQPSVSPRTVFIRAIVRPSKLLIFSPIVLLLSLFTAIVYGYLYLLFTTFPTIFQDQYHFSGGIVGLAYLGMGVGTVIGVFTCAMFSDRLMKRSADGQTKPEYRLLMMIYGAPCIPIGLFWFGWSAAANTHWIVPIIGSSFFGIGIICVFLPVQTYMVDAYTIYAASALAANTAVRSAVGAVLPLAGQSMFDKLGLGWGCSLLAFVALAMTPVPWAFFKKGEYLRERFSKPL